MNVNAIYELAKKPEDESLAICTKLVSKLIVILLAGRFTKFCIDAFADYDISIAKVADNAVEKHGENLILLVKHMRLYL